MLNSSTIVPDGVVLSSRSGEVKLGMMVSGGQVEALLAA